MSLEGGNFTCYLHGEYVKVPYRYTETKNGKTIVKDYEKEVFKGFETSSVKEWNEHCIKEGHTEEGSTRCRECDVEIKFRNLPFHPFDELGHKNISLACPKCQKKQSQVEVQYA